jgi:hypothetical protein
MVEALGIDRSCTEPCQYRSGDEQALGAKHLLCFVDRAEALGIETR